MKRGIIVALVLSALIIGFTAWQEFGPAHSIAVNPGPVIVPGSAVQGELAANLRMIGEASMSFDENDEKSLLASQKYFTSAAWDGYMDDLRKAGLITDHGVPIRTQTFKISQGPVYGAHTHSDYTVIFTGTQTLGTISGDLSCQMTVAGPEADLAPKVIVITHFTCGAVPP